MGGQIRRGRIWRFWGAPIFSPEVPTYQFLKGLGTSGRKIGAPQKRQIQPRRIWPPICGPLTYSSSGVDFNSKPNFGNFDLLSSAHSRFHPKGWCVPCCQPTKEIHHTEWQGNRGFGMLARNLPGICPELRVRSEFARSSLEKRPRPAMRGTLHVDPRIT